MFTMLTKQLKTAQTSGSPLLIARDISFEPRTGHPIVQNLSASFSTEKTGLVGKNGVGKTTLLRLLVGELGPTSGSIEISGRIAYLPQDLQFALDKTIAEALGIDEKLNAIQEVKNGNKTPGNLKIIDNDWDIKDRSLETLAKLGFEDVNLDRQLSTLSGGERMKVVLASRLIWQPNFLILDEPTNNLDYQSREVVYNLVRNWPGGILVVSHDRELLNLMDRILELSVHGLQEYGGNFEFYEKQRETEAQAAQENLHHAKKELRKTKQQAQEVKQRQAKRSSQGKKSIKDRGIPRIIAGAMERKAEKTTAKLKGMHEEKIQDAKGNLQEAKAKIRPENEIKIDLSATEVPNGKLVIELKNATFTYPQTPESPVLENFDLAIFGPERLSIAGPNGSGKTTLVKLMLGELEPTAGEITRGVNNTAYLDQHTQVLDRSKTLLENLQDKLPSYSETSLRKWLGRFLFSDEDVFRTVGNLSGGEKMRAALSIILAGDHPPQLLVLDEPTNNLDLNSIEQIESALMNYEGALVVISHDQKFLKNIGIERKIQPS